MKEIFAIVGILVVLLAAVLFGDYQDKRHAENVNEQTIRCVEHAKNDTIAMRCFN